MLPGLSVPLVQSAPRLSSDAVIKIVRELYGLEVTSVALPSERDQNFLLTDAGQRKFVFKIANSLEPDAFQIAQCEAISHLTKRHSFFPQIVKSVNGCALERVQAADGETNLVRLASFVPGTALGEMRHHSLPLLRDLGRKLGLMDSELLEFDHPAVHREFHWDLANWRIVTEEYGVLIVDEGLRSLVVEYSSTFDRQVAPKLAVLRTSCIHGDTNDYNILVSDDGLQVVGVIDFGDMVYSYTVADLAIALAYVVLQNESPLQAASSLLEGFNEVLPLREEEVQAIWPLAMMRLCMSVSIAAYQRQQQPENQYLSISQQAIQDKLPQLMALHV